MKILLFILVCSFTLKGFSQPVITDASNIILPGNTYNALISNIADLGTPGADQTWDFSSNSFSTLTTLSIVDPALTDFAAEFPTATWAYEAGPWTSYFEATSTEFNNLAFNISSTGGDQDYSADPRQVLQFPFNYAGSYTDTYMENGMSKNLTVTYEGYGTLNMPDGYSYSDVVRIREEDDGGEVTTRYYTLDPFMNIGVHFASNSFFTWIQTPSTNSVNENTQTSFSVYPNPATDFIDIQTESNEEMEFMILDLNGKIISRFNVNNTEKGNSVNVSALNSGYYLLSNGTKTVSFQKF